MFPVMSQEDLKKGLQQLGGGRNLGASRHTGDCAPTPTTSARCRLSAARVEDADRPARRSRAVVPHGWSRASSRLERDRLQTADSFGLAPHRGRLAQTPCREREAESVSCFAKATEGIAHTGGDDLASGR